MNTKTPFLLLSLLTLSCAGPLGKAEKERKQANAFEELQEEYAFNAEFTIPKLTLEGISYGATIEFPSGLTYASETLTLSESGVYTIHYSAESKGRFYSLDKTFLVRCPYVQFSGRDSYASYEQSERTYGKKGLYVSLAEGETLTFNKPIDIAEGGLLFEGFAAPGSVGTMEFGELRLTLSEMGNPENALSFRAKATNDGMSNPYTYWSAKAPEQSYAGYEIGANTIHVNNDFGCSCTHSFYGYYGGKEELKGATCGDYTLNLTYKPEEKAAYTNGNLIADFDDPDFFSTLWEGFGNERATLSISAGSYSSSVANFVILSALGQDLSQQTIYDEEAPSIEIDLPETLPSAKAGCSYPAFSAKAIDAQDGECPVSVRAYYSFGGETPLLLPLENGRFPTTREGVYVLRYEAKDKSGNLASRTVPISTGAVAPLTLSPKGQEIKTCRVGEEYFFPEMEAQGGEQRQEIAFSVSKGGAGVESSASSFIPETLGSYLIKATVSDLLGQSASYEYELEVKSNDQAVLHGDILLPKYYIADAIYTLPKAVCCDYSSGEKKEILMDVTISNGVYPYTLKAGEQFVPKVEQAQQEISLTFAYKNLSIVKKALVVSPFVMGKDGIERFSIENYFVSENANVEVEDTKLTLTAKKKGGMSAAFVNPILAESSSLILSSLPSGGEVKTMSLTYEDSLNPEEKITVSLKKDEGSGKVSFGLDSRFYPTSASLSSPSELRFSYSSGVFSFNSSGIKAKYYDDLTPFEGFSSGKVYVSLSLPSLIPGMGCSWVRIDNQSMGYASSDYNPPRIALSGSYGGTGSLGEKALINEAISSDVLDPNSVCTVSVSSPSGGSAKDDDGVSLSNVPASREYRLSLSEYGQYIVTYKASDSSSQTASFIYAINVEDQQAPTIALKEETPSEITLGESFAIPEIEVSDNSGESCALFIAILTPEGRRVVLDEDHNAFKPASRGVYTLSIRASDPTGNVAYLRRQIKVI